MRFSATLVAALPALALAQEQVPLADKVKGWFNKAQNYVSSAAPAVQSPVQAATGKVAERKVTTLELDTWKAKLHESTAATAAAPAEWMIYVNGGNDSCYGLCGNATKAWNEAVTYLSVKPGKVPNLGLLDCDKEPILCAAWSIGPPSIYYFLLPQPLADQSTPATTVYYHRLNRTTVTAETITDLVVKDGYKSKEPYEGAFHPFDGVFATSGTAVPLGYFMYYTSKMPSWLPMILISFFSRSIMNKRLNPQPRPASGAPNARGQ